MKKIPSLFKRNYDGDRLVRDEVVEGSEWVLAGEGVATAKHDGTSCMVRGGALYKRYDRKPPKSAKRKHQKGTPWVLDEFKAAPDGWIPAEPVPNLHTGHWPGWLLVGDGPEDKYHRQVLKAIEAEGAQLRDGTYELAGPKVQGNPHGFDRLKLLRHEFFTITSKDASNSYNSIRAYLYHHRDIEGIVWHHPDGRMVKIKRRDFGLEWPVKEGMSDE